VPVRSRVIENAAPEPAVFLIVQSKTHLRPINPNAIKAALSVPIRSRAIENAAPEPAVFLIVQSKTPPCNRQRIVV